MLTLRLFIRNVIYDLNLSGLSAFGCQKVLLLKTLYIFCLIVIVLRRRSHSVHVPACRMDVDLNLKSGLLFSMCFLSVEIFECLLLLNMLFVFADTLIYLNV